MMAASTTSQAGIQGWMASIRSSLEDDPIRKTFEEQVQRTGFDYVKDFLDNVLENPQKRGPAIADLLKTPGRRKGGLKKTRAAQIAAARAQDAIKLNMEEDVLAGGKENSGPVNRFHEALLQAKRADDEDNSGPRTPLSPKPHSSNPPDSRTSIIDVSSSPARPPLAVDHADFAHSPAPPALDDKAKELSMIAEDDEMSSAVPRRVLPGYSSPANHNDASPIHVQPTLPAVEEQDDIIEDEAPPSPSPSARSTHAAIRETPPAATSHSPSPSPAAASPAPPIPQDAPLPAVSAVQDAAPDSAEVAPPRRTFGKSVLGGPPAAPSALYTSMAAANPPAAANAGAPKRTSGWIAAAMKHRASRAADTTALAVPDAGHLKRKSGDMGPSVEPERVKHPKLSHDNAMEVDAPPAVFSAPALDAPRVDEPFANLLKRIQDARPPARPLSNAAVAVAELAQAKAEAQRRIDDKYGLPASASPAPEHSATPPPAVQPDERQTSSDRRFSLSELVSSKSEPASIASLGPPRAVNLSASTTPPESPQAYISPKPAFTLAAKPAPVFVPPPAPTLPEASGERSAPLGEFSFKLPSSSVLSLRPQLGLGMAPGGRSPRANSGASTQESEPADPVFDSQPFPLSRQVSNSTQGTTQSHSQDLQYAGVCTDYAMPLADEDDTWGVSEKLAATTQTWTPYTTSNHTDTWSSGPSDTQTQPAGTFTHPFANTMAEGTTWSDWPTDSTDSTRLRKAEADAPAEDVDEEFADAHDQPEPYVDDMAEDIVDAASPPGVRLVQSKSVASLRSESQLSMVSSSDESHPGFMGQASKLVSSIFGGPGNAKKDKAQIKSVQLAAAAKAAASKKQQDEQDRRATRQKELETRRLAAVQRKADEERQRIEEEERKAREVKEEAERRRKEREEAAAKRAKAAEKKASDDEASKKKIVEKPKSAMKKPAPIPKIVKTAPAPASAAKPKTLSKQASTTSLADKSMKAPLAKGKAKPAVADSDTEARPKAGPSTHFKTPAPPKAAAAKPPPESPEEWIDLPEPNSEYSNSDDDDKGKDYDVADWAQPDVLTNQLRHQETIDPDDIFGPIQPLRMEDMFTGRARQSRFRARSSSANWAHGDGLTEAESREYARRMGFR